MGDATGTTYHDVTEQRQLEQTLRESQQQFHTLADSIPQLAWHPDEVERVVDRIQCAFATGEAWEDTFPLRS